MKRIEKPKVFISYAWGSKEYQNRVLSFAKELLEVGIDVLLDKFDLHEGNDTYSFMEKSVNDPTVTNVLILLDPIYADKADLRKGGVGTETQIISAEVYNNIDQTKFLPVIFEKGENGEVPRPAYLKSILYFDLSSDENYSNEFRRLVKSLYGEEVYKKPALGTKPKWVTDSIDESQSMRTAKRQRLKKEAASHDLFNELLSIINYNIDALKDFSFENTQENAVEMYEELKDLRANILDVIALVSYCPAIVKEIALSFEGVYNDIVPNNVYGVDNMKLTLIHELFIYLVAACYKNRLNKNLGYIFSRSYYTNKMNEFSTFTLFRTSNNSIDVAVSKRDGKQYYSGLAEYWLQNVDYTVCTKADFIFADTLCFNASIFYHQNYYDHYWFPLTYIYMDEDYNSPLRIFARKLESRERLIEAAELFGFDTTKQFVDEFIKIEGETNKEIQQYRYMNSYKVAQTIFQYIRSNELGKLK